LNIFSSIQTYHSTQKTIVTLGTFDGVHLGHQSILKQLVTEAKQASCQSLVLTFFPHPRMVLKHDDTIKLINTIDEKTALLANLGIDNLVIHAFNDAFSQLSGEEFVKQVLVECFKVQKIIVGHDHRFGKGGTCNFDDLVAFGHKYNFEVEQISAHQINRVAVSSTKVRQALLNGDVAQANAFLGYPYSLSGTVVQGKQLGRTLGFPTANIKVPQDYKLIPKEGVYLVEVHVLNNTYFGMLNIGTNPTVNGQEQTIEVHILNFDADIYEQVITLTFLEKIREVTKFNSIEQLKAQLLLDKQAAVAYFKL